MRRGKGKPFQKGQSGNPSGSSRVRRELKGVRMMPHREVVELATQILDSTLEELAEIKNEQGASVHKIWLASLVIKGIKTQDARIYSQVMDRICGRPREHAVIEHTGVDGGPIRTTKEMTDVEIKTELARLRAVTSSDD